MTRAIDVSVIIPAWNAAGLVEKAVASSLASTGVRLEVIAIDDGSDDATYEILLELSASDFRVVVDRLAVNSGPSAARNRAIALAKGRYIAVLDADDMISPGRLASLVALANDRRADVVVDNMIEVDEDGQRVGPELFLKSRTFAKPRDVDLATWALFNQPMKPGDCLGYLKPLIRRSTLDEASIRYDTKLWNSEDYYLTAHLLAEGARMIYTPEAGYVYRRSAASASHRLTPEHTQAWLAAERRFRALYSGRLSEDAEAALDVRERTLREVNQFVAAVDAMKGRRPVDALGVLVSDLRASAFTLGALAKIGVGKALGRRLV